MKILLLSVLSICIASNLMAQFELTSDQTELFTTKNVGIGTNNPAYKLDINGNLRLGYNQFLLGRRLDGGTSNMIGYAPMESGNHILAISEYSTIPSEVRIYTPMDNNQGVSIYSDFQLAFFRNDGYVGIGTANPRTLFNISSTSPAFDIYDSDGAVDAKSWQMGVTANVMHFSVRNDANTLGADYLRVIRSANTITSVSFPNGNVGIGTNNPKSNLDVNGNAFISNLRIVDDISIGVETSWIYSKPGNDRQLGLLLTNDGNTKAEVKLWEGNSHNPYISFSTASAHNKDISERMRIDKYGNIGIGTTSPSEKLEVNGTIRSKEVKVEASPWPDYVFFNTYKLRSLEETSTYIKENGHLPEVPSAAEVAENGVNLGEMNALLLKKIEELTLYLVDQSEQSKKQLERIQILEKELSKLSE